LPDLSLGRGCHVTPDDFHRFREGLGGAELDVLDASLEDGQVAGGDVELAPVDLCKLAQSL
jgi:hypothetical protein